MKSKASKFAFNFYDAIAIDPSNPNLSVTQFYEALVEQLGLEVEKSEWKTELVFDSQGKAVLNKDGTQKRKKFKLRRINSDSWQWFEMFCEHRLQMKERRETQEEITSDRVPTTSQNVYEIGGGWNITQPNTEQEIEGDFSAQKLDAITTAVTPEIEESLVSINTQESESNDVPTSPQNLYETEGGWNMGQPHTGQEIESDLEREKMEPNQRANAERRNSNLASSNEQPLSTTTHVVEDNHVPTTPAKVYETEVGWNTNQNQTEQEIEGDFSPRKIEATDDELQVCLKQLRQVKTADDYWVLYERSSHLVEEAWKWLNSPEQLRIQQICEEGVDPLALWKEGDRCLLWHPFAQEKWGLATIKKVVTGTGGLLYVLRDDGFGLHLGQEKFHLIASI